jgi:acyl-CoA reductase-like NAD-dependent aldehyde dehydrogenase
MAQANGKSFTPPSGDWTVPLWLNGEQVHGSKIFDIISPLTDKPLYKSAAASKEDALAAVSAAEKAFPAWSRTKPGHRRDLLLKAAEELVRRKDDLWYFCSQETGSTGKSQELCAGFFTAWLIVEW